MGSLAERIVEHYLTLEGATIVRRNLRGIGFEIDLVVEWGEDLVAVEVKLRRSSTRDLVFAESLRVGPRKLSRIKLGLLTVPGDFRTRRIDLAVVDLKKDGTLHLGAYHIGIE